MDNNPANAERRAHACWTAYCVLQTVSNRLSKLPPRHAVSDPRTLKLLGAPRNTRAAVLLEKAKNACQTARQEALESGTAAFEWMSGLRQPLGRSVDIVRASGLTRRLVLDEIFVTQAPTTRWVPSGKYELRGADLEDSLALTTLCVDTDDDFVDLTP